jgi:ribonuclease J
MKLIIHRGTKEIGGSCVELKTEKARIIIDLGMPLVNDRNERFDSNILQGKCIAELVENRTLPKINGLYTGEQKEIDAVLISHPHQDHYGLLKYINPDIPVYLSKGSLALIQASDIFIPVKTNLHNVITFENKESYTIGDIKITPRLVDHSGFDAVAFTIECEGKKIFYSGDFRGHGRKGVLLDILCKYPEKDVDYLFLEGSMLGRSKCLFPSEKAVEDEMASIFKNKSNIAFVFCSSQNIDRIVSIYRAAKRNGQITVIDLYTAYILDSIKHISKRLPQYWWDDIKVVFFRHHQKSLLQNGLDIFLDEMAEHEITMDNINLNKKNFVMITKDNNFFPILLNSLDDCNGVQAIYSQWEGYLENNNLQDMLKQKGITLEKIHTSGHAPEPDLQRLVEAYKPKCIIPIHTFYPENYASLFPNYEIKMLNDGEEFIL